MWDAKISAGCTGQRRRAGWRQSNGLYSGRISSHQAFRQKDVRQIPAPKRSKMLLLVPFRILPRLGRHGDE